MGQWAGPCIMYYDLLRIGLFCGSLGYYYYYYEKEWIEYGRNPHSKPTWGMGWDGMRTEVGLLTYIKQWTTEPLASNPYPKKKGNATMNFVHYHLLLLLLLFKNRVYSCGEGGACVFGGGGGGGDSTVKLTNSFEILYWFSHSKLFFKLPMY